VEWRATVRWQDQLHEGGEAVGPIRNPRRQSVQWSGPNQSRTPDRTVSILARAPSVRKSQERRSTPAEGGTSPPSNRTGCRPDSTTTAHRPGSRQSNGSRRDWSARRAIRSSLVTHRREIRKVPVENPNDHVVVSTRFLNPATVISTTRSCPHCRSGRATRLASRMAGWRISTVHATSAQVPVPSGSSRS
jgi:hypothetical protein